MCIDFVDDMKFSIDYADFEDICRHFNLDESMREVLLKRLKQVEGIAIYKNKKLVNLDKFYNAIIMFKDLQPINETVKEETAKILVNLIKKDVDNK